MLIIIWLMIAIFWIWMTLSILFIQIPTNFLLLFWLGYPLFVILGSLHNLLRIYGTPLNRSTDASDERHDFDYLVPRQVAGEIEHLKFTRLGETNTRIYGEWFTAKKNITWYYKNPSGTIIVEIPNLDVMACQFTTVLADRAVVETSYGLGEHIQKKNYYSSLNQQSIDATLKQHIQVVKQHISRHGRPIGIRDMERLLKYDEYYHQHYSMNKLGGLATSAWISFVLGMIPYTFIVGGMIIVFGFLDY